MKTRATKSGRRYRVEFRVGGRESQSRYGGSFKTLREATIRKNWIAGELAALRAPEIRPARADRAPTPTEAGERWRQSRIDVVEQTGNMRRSAFVRIFRVAPEFRSRRVDEVTVDDFTTTSTRTRYGTSACGYRENARRTSRRRSPSTSSESPRSSRASTSSRSS
jgi:hypothetical protein